MVQAARSGVQNIAEGSMASATSKKTELKLTNVAKASQEELRLDYEDFLRHRELPLWESRDPRRQDLVNRRCSTADEVARWIKEICGQDGQDGQSGQSTSAQSRKSRLSTESTKSFYAGTAANAVLVLIRVATSLLNRQISAQAKAFENEGGFTERLYRVRTNRRRRKAWHSDVI